MKLTFYKKTILIAGFLANASVFAQSAKVQAPKIPMKAVFCSGYWACGIGKNDSYAYCKSEGAIFRSKSKNVQAIALGNGWRSDHNVHVLADGYYERFSGYEVEPKIPADKLYSVGPWGQAMEKDGKLIGLSSWDGGCYAASCPAPVFYKDDSFRITSGPNERTMYHSEFEKAKQLAVSDRVMCGWMKDGRVLCENLYSAQTLEVPANLHIKGISAGRYYIALYTKNSIHVISSIDRGNMALQPWMEGFDGIKKVVVNNKGQVIALRENGLVYLMDRWKYQNTEPHPLNKIKVSDISTGNSWNVCSLQEDGSIQYIDPNSGEIEKINFEGKIHTF